MILELRERLAAYGLKLHPTKCKVQTNCVNPKRSDAELDHGFVVNVLDEGEGIKVLGTFFCVDAQITKEIRHRIRAAWAKFNQMRRLLLHKGASLQKRLKLFAATVGSCLLWCAESWTPRQDEVQALKTTQDKMLRSMTGINRRPDDVFCWIQRAARRARCLASAQGVRFWDASHAELEWKWA